MVGNILCFIADFIANQGIRTNKLEFLFYVIYRYMVSNFNEPTHQDIKIESKLRILEFTLVNVYVDLVVFTRIAGTS